jgi:serine/threonine protein kinase
VPALDFSSTRVFLDFALGVQALHGAEQLHRDLKPENMLLHHTTRHGLVADLGSSKPVNSQTIRGVHEFRHNRKVSDGGQDEDIPALNFLEIRFPKNGKRTGDNIVAIGVLSPDDFFSSVRHD